jgi:hypothetical protein
MEYWNIGRQLRLVIGPEWHRRRLLAIRGNEIME